MRQAARERLEQVYNELLVSESVCCLRARLIAATIMETNYCLLSI